MSKWILFAIPVVLFLLYQMGLSQPKLYTEISAQEAFHRLSEFQVIDVREEDEWRGALGHIKEAKLMPLGQVAQKSKEIDQSKPVLFVCRSGRRSASASQMLSQQGYQVFNLSGGMQNWNQAKLPVILEK
jgi:rhodanese-related sulfurtransferase